MNALALVAAHPGDVRRVVAHEPPTAALLPDREVLVRACERLRETYLREGHGAAMAAFIALVTVEGELDEGYLERPDPASFGLPTQDDGSRTDPLFRNLPACNAYRPDVDALRARREDVLLAVGEESGETFAARGARSVAAALGREAVVLPGDHGGFMGAVHGRPAGRPEEFARRLVQLLA